MDVCSQIDWTSQRSASSVERMKIMSVERIEYDKLGRMRYHSKFHFSHGERFAESDLEYICKYYEVDHTRTLGFAIGKTEHTIRSKVDKLKRLVYSSITKILINTGRRKIK